MGSANIWVIYYLYFSIYCPFSHSTPPLLHQTLTYSPLFHSAPPLPSSPSHSSSPTSHFGMIDDHDALLLGSLLTLRSGTGLSTCFTLSHTLFFSHIILALSLSPASPPPSLISFFSGTLSHSPSICNTPMFSAPIYPLQSWPNVQLKNISVFQDEKYLTSVRSPFLFK